MLPHVPGPIFLLDPELERRESPMQELGCESGDHPIQIRGVPNHKLDEVLQWIETLGFRVKSLLIPLRLFEDGHLEDDVSSHLRGFVLEAIIELNSDDSYPWNEGATRSRPHVVGHDSSRRGAVNPKHVFEVQPSLRGSTAPNPLTKHGDATLRVHAFGGSHGHEITLCRPRFFQFLHQK